jgi:hypothetical protein
MEKNDIVSVITAAGEFIGKLDWETDTRLKLTDPRMLIRQKAWDLLGVFVLLVLKMPMR